VAIVLGSLRDREEAEQERVREAERLAGMGKALSGLAHDLKTPLIAIGGLGRSMQKKMAPKDPFLGKMQIIVKESGRLEKMMGDILDFARPLTLNRDRGYIQESIAHTLSIAETIAERKHLKLLMQTSGGLPIFLFDRLRLEQCLLNLVKNAIEATPEGETVWISSTCKGPNLMIEVTDRGDGISAHKREEIFEPFVTTKDGGTGLGLPIARKIIESHRGHIEIIHNPKGTTFRAVNPMH
jgi:signal transduction histidine kinase